MPESAADRNAAQPMALGQRLVERGCVTSEDLDRALALQREHGGRLGRLLVDLGFARQSDVLAAQAEQFGLPFLRGEELGRGLPPTTEIPAGFLRQFRCMPVAEGERGLQVAIADPLDLETLSSIQSLTSMPVTPVLATEPDILAAIDERYGLVPDAGPARRDTTSIEHLQDLASDAPVVRFVNALITRALEDRASDIHLEPLSDAFRVRVRIDGALEDRPAPPARLRAPVVSRLKLLAGLDIAERRLPQDGRIAMKALGRELDLRVATLPTLHGESLAMRLLDHAASHSFTLEALGLDEGLLARMERLASLPHGLLLVTGPTGSGKTTTLHAALRRINSPTRKIVTIEDPVEYRIAGVSQIHVNPAIGLTFAAGLRHIVRQDPDVIMVGEIRDQETAEIAVRAALTGHLVCATLHTNDAPSAVARLADMGVERYLIASSLVAVMAQRLVRLLCTHCRAPSRPVAVPDGRTVNCWKAVGCEHCRGQGYRGRIGIFELFEVDEPVRRAITERSDLRDIGTAVAPAEFRRLQANGWSRVEQGLTSVEEVLDATQER